MVWISHKCKYYHNFNNKIRILNINTSFRIYKSRLIPIQKIRLSSLSKETNQILRQPRNKASNLSIISKTSLELQEMSMIKTLQCSNQLSKTQKPMLTYRVGVAMYLLTPRDSLNSQILCLNPYKIILVSEEFQIIQPIIIWCNIKCREKEGSKEPLVMSSRQRFRILLPETDRDSILRILQCSKDKWEEMGITVQMSLTCQVITRRAKTHSLIWSWIQRERRCQSATPYPNFLKIFPSVETSQCQILFIQWNKLVALRKIWEKLWLRRITSNWIRWVSKKTVMRYQWRFLGTTNSKIHLFMTQLTISERTDLLIC